MNYHIDAESISLNNLRQRIEQTDLVPSRTLILDAIKEKFFAIEQQGIHTLASLRVGLKNNKRLDDLTERTGIERGYLVLLRREIESYFPRPFSLNEYHWLSEKMIAKLDEVGIRTSAAYYLASTSPEEREELANQIETDLSDLNELFQLVDLSRVQWVNPTAARMLIESGIRSVSQLAASDPESLCAALDQANKGGKYFKGKIGLRDIKRLVSSAGYLCE